LQRKHETNLCGILITPGWKGFGASSNRTATSLLSPDVGSRPQVAGRNVGKPHFGCYRVGHSFYRTKTVWDWPPVVAGKLKKGKYCRFRGDGSITAITQTSLHVRDNVAKNARLLSSTGILDLIQGRRCAYFLNLNCVRFGQGVKRSRGSFGNALRSNAYNRRRVWASEVRMIAWFLLARTGQKRRAVHLIKVSMTNLDPFLLGLADSILTGFASHQHFRCEGSCGGEKMLSVLAGVDLGGPYENDRKVLVITAPAGSNLIGEAAGMPPDLNK